MQVNAGLDARAIEQIRHIFAGMVGGLVVGRVAAVVCRDHQNIIGTHFFHERRQPVVELGQRGGVARHIPAVAVQHIEIHQIHKGKALEIPVGQLPCDPQSLGVAGGADGLANAAACENVINFAHADGSLARRLNGVQHGGRGRHKAVIVAAGRAGEIRRAAAHKGTGDDAPHAPRASEQLPRLFADLIQLFHRDQFLMGGDLEHTVRRGVDDESAGFQMLLAIIFQHLRTGIRPVAQHLIAGFSGEGVQKFLRKSLREGGQRLRAEQTRDLPVTDGGILAGAGLPQAGVAADGRGAGRGAGHAVQIEQAQSGQIVPLETGMRRHGGQRVGPGIAKCGGIRFRTHAKAVQNDEKDPFGHPSFPPLSVVGFIIPYFPQKVQCKICSHLFWKRPPQDLYC